MFQTAFWAEVKQINGWLPIAVRVSSDSRQYTVLILKRRILPGCSLCYVPFGIPYIDHERRFDELLNFSKSVRSIVGDDAFVLRFDVPWESGVKGSFQARRGLHELPFTIQPEGTVRILLEGSDERTILGQMKKRAQRNIRKASAETRIEAWDGSERQLRSWYAIYRATSVRDSFDPRAFRYFRDMLDIKPTCGVNAVLYLGYVHGRMVGGNIVVFTANEATYLFGASDQQDLTISPSYALQWYSIRQALSRGCSTYDLYGIGPEGDEDHHLHNLTLFKTGFGGRKVFREGCFDVSLRSLPYKCFRVIEQLRMLRAR